MRRKLLFVVNVDWFFLSHRLPIALEAMRQGYEVHIATGLTSKLDVLVGHGLIVHPLSLRRGSTAMGGVLYSIYEIYSVMRKVRPDVVHLVTIKPVLLGGLAARLAKVPSVVSAISGLGYVFLDSGVKAWVRRFFVKKIYAFSLGHHNLKVIFQNKDDQDNVSQLANLTQENSLLIRGSGVDLREYVNKPIPDGVPVVMLAARMLKDKGVQEFVDAARLLKKAEYSPANGVRCVLVGEPDLENPASLSKETLEAWGREGVVEVWGGGQ
ncbi:glycosyltransferase [Chromobacterium haemolyticum]|nr:glycosyltransferase [Chromobacterium haemolyticum]